MGIGLLFAEYLVNRMRSSRVSICFKGAAGSCRFVTSISIEFDFS